jgi:hypothetical protein
MKIYVIIQTDIWSEECCPNGMGFYDEQLAIKKAIELTNAIKRNEDNSYFFKVHEIEMQDEQHRTMFL